GQLQSKRRDPVELAADPAATRACAIRGRARGRASRRAQSLATILGAGREAVSGPRRSPSRTLGVVDAARVAARAARRGPPPTARGSEQSRVDAGGRQLDAPIHTSGAEAAARTAIRDLRRPTTQVRAAAAVRQRVRPAISKAQSVPRRATR